MVFMKGTFLSFLLCLAQCSAQSSVINFQNIFLGLENAAYFVTSTVELAALQVYLIYGAERSRSDTAKIFLFDGPSTNEYKSFSLAYPVHLLEYLDLSLPTVMYIHGFNDAARDISVQTVVKAYIKRGGFNILALDWSELCVGDYFRNAIPNVFMLATILAKTLLNLFKHGLIIEKFHLIGHSLGAQMAGLCGKEIQKITDGKTKMDRITALDPAGPGFGSKYLIHVNRTDAVFVEVIHTDGGVFGMREECGTVDFYPNRGSRLQPGCSVLALDDVIDPCSHQLCWKLWAESVTAVGPNIFQAVHFESWTHYVRGNFTVGNVAKIGIDCPRNSKGKYYLETNPEPPYSKT